MCTEPLLHIGHSFVINLPLEARKCVFTCTTGAQHRTLKERPILSGGNFRKSVPTCMRYASVRRLEVFENPWKDARKFWQPDWPPKTQPISVGMFHGLPSRPCRGSSEEIF